MFLVRAKWGGVQRVVLLLTALAVLVPAFIEQCSSLEIRLSGTVSRVFGKTGLWFLPIWHVFERSAQRSTHLVADIFTGIVLNLI